MCRILMCGSFKGGVGKSVTTFNSAYSLAEVGKKVLAVDFDSQVNLSTCFGIQSRNKGHYWYLRCSDVPGDMACIIFHKRKYNHPYRQHDMGTA